MNKLKEFKKQNNITWEALAEQIGISYQALNEIILRRSPNTKVSTCIAIKKITGLEPFDYLDGLECLKLLNNKK